MRAPRAVLALAAAALVLPGCYAARVAFPTDPSEMEFAAGWVGKSVKDQCRRTADGLAGLPEALGDHFAECWRNISVDPRERPR